MIFCILNIKYIFNSKIWYFFVFSESMKAKAKKNVQDAFQAEQNRTREFAHGVANELTDDFKLTETSISADEERPQPSIFKGNLKHYQLKGMNWLANLYDQVCIYFKSVRI